MNVARARSWAWRLLWVVVLVVIVGRPSLRAQSERIFSVPLDDLKQWSEAISVAMNVALTGNSKVHAVKNDCEMHFGASVAGFTGDPPGFVLEPMNVCEVSFPGKPSHSNADWESWARSLKGARVRVEGIPRIWPEHLVGGTDSNPDHAVELHPLTKLQRGNQVFDFTREYIYAPDGFSGGLSEASAESLLTKLEVSVVEDAGQVEITFKGGRIGNFATLSVSVVPKSIVEQSGGHRMDGQVLLDNGQGVPVRLLSVAATDIDDTIAKLKLRKYRRSPPFDVLALFSLNPETLYAAAKTSHGQPVLVDTPIQLILYGQVDREQ